MAWLTVVASFAEEHTGGSLPHTAETETDTETETETEIIAVVIFHPQPD
jgi:hypothetical protein